MRRFRLKQDVMSGAGAFAPGDIVTEEQVTLATLEALAARGDAEELVSGIDGTTNVTEQTAAEMIAPLLAGLAAKPKVGEVQALADKAGLGLTVTAALIAAAQKLPPPAAAQAS